MLLVLRSLGVVFRVQFIEKYFSEDVHRNKEIEFLELKQGNMVVAEYAAKLEELVKFCPHYNGAAVEVSKFIKFENGLRPEIKQGISYQKIRRFPTIVNKCRIYDEDYMACTTHYNSVSERKGNNQFRGKPYSALTDKGKQRTIDDKKPSGGVTLASVKCFRCGESGHRANECKNYVLRCFKCGKTGYRVVYSKSDGPIFYNCGEIGHISINCQKPKKAQSGGKVFSLSEIETTSADCLIRGTCFINVIPFIAIIDTCVTHSFVSLDCAEKLGLKLSSTNESMIIDTPTIGLVLTLWVCLNYPLTIYGKSFGMDLVCLCLRNLDVILGMNRLELNHVYINYVTKTMSFPEFDTSDELFV
ncbi:uncharacterized protein LOC127098435 [Lathyrus oleraceus]|uniref:uncharacterized protein LOC127098435 n=1 Tax=Pisum sativum TaxID=3888 RepID=UPI0021CF6D9F|nr:uncharacterized protein LOC127098435 [Pisum sativum]